MSALVPESQELRDVVLFAELDGDEKVGSGELVRRNGEHHADNEHEEAEPVFHDFTNEKPACRLITNSDR